MVTSVTIKKGQLDGSGATLHCSERITYSW
jgi:hypothetical protein